MEVGSSLLIIRDSRLYRASYSTFEDYCRTRWGMSKTHANRMIEATKVADNLTPMGVIPATERQVRSLASLPPDQQREAWTEATQKAEAEDRPVTARDVTDAVYKLKPHVAQNSGENEWYTPPEFIEAARKVMGGIDLDPASSEIANRIVQAKYYFTKEEDGLEKVWYGNVFMNPPYASELIKQFAEKFSTHVIDGSISQGIVLVNNATETLWFREIIDCASAVVFTTGRVKFLDPQGNPGAPLQGQAIIYCGTNEIEFLEQFSKFGWGARL